MVDTAGIKLSTDQWAQKEWTPSQGIRAIAQVPARGVIKNINTEVTGASCLLTQAREDCIERNHDKTIPNGKAHSFCPRETASAPL